MPEGGLPIDPLDPIDAISRSSGVWPKELLIQSAHGKSAAKST